MHLISALFRPKTFHSIVLAIPSCCPRLMWSLAWKFNLYLRAYVHARACEQKYPYFRSIETGVSLLSDLTKDSIESASVAIILHFHSSSPHSDIFFLFFLSSFFLFARQILVINDRSSDIDFEQKIHICCISFTSNKRFYIDGIGTIFWHCASGSICFY